MKKKERNNNQPVVHTPHEENDEIISALLTKLDADYKKEMAGKLTKLGLSAVAVAVLATGAKTAIKKMNTQTSPSNPPAVVEMVNKDASTNFLQEPIEEPKKTEPKLYKDSYGEKMYYYITEDSFLQIAEESMARVEKMLLNAGATPVGTDNGSFYPEYYNAYMLAGIAKTESSLRVVDENGNPVVSKDGALGLMQILPKTVDGINEWLRDTMKIYDVSYTVEDLSDPVKSIDIANLVLIETCKNYGKEYCNNPIYKMMGEEFSLERQKQIVIATYNQGAGNAIAKAKNGTFKKYLKEGNADNYYNTVTKNEQYFVNKHSSSNEQ